MVFEVVARNSQTCAVCVATLRPSVTWARKQIVDAFCKSDFIWVAFRSNKLCDAPRVARCIGTWYTHSANGRIDASVRPLYLLAQDLPFDITCLCMLHQFEVRAVVPSRPFHRLAASRKTSRTCGSQVTPEPKSMGRSASRQARLTSRRNSFGASRHAEIRSMSVPDNLTKSRSRCLACRAALPCFFEQNISCRPVRRFVQPGF